MPPTAGARRSNDAWVQALRSTGPEATIVQGELQALVRGALGKALGAQGIDDATLDDLTQIAVLQILQKLERFEGRSRFTTWAYSVALRAALTELRKAGVAPGSTEDSAAALDVEAPDADPGRPAEREEVVAALHRAIEEDLTEKQRAAILGELSGRAPGDLAHELGTNRNALYKLLFDARGRLRDALEAAGISDDEVREAFGL